MTEPQPTIEHYRDLIADLRGRVAHRVDLERRLAEFDRTHADAEAGEEAPLTPEAIEAQFADGMRQVDEYETTTKADVEAWYETEKSAAVFDYDDRLKEVEEPLSERSENNPKWQHETFKKRMKADREERVEKWQEVKTLYEKAVANVEARSLSVSGDPAPRQTPEDREQADEVFDAAAAAARERWGRLKNVRTPLLFQPGRFLVIGMATMLGLFAACYFEFDPTWVGLTNDPITRLLVSGVVAFGLTTAFFATLHMSGQRRTKRLFDDVHQDVVDARTAHKVWVDAAKEAVKSDAKASKKRYAELVEQRDESRVEFERDRDERLVEVEEERKQRLEAAEKARRDAAREWTGWRTAQLQAADAAAAGILNQRAQARRELLDARNEHWQSGLERLSTTDAELQRRSDETFPAWPTILEEPWEYPTTIPDGIRIGAYAWDLARIPDVLPHETALRPHVAELSLPAVLPFPSAPSLVVHADGDGKSRAIRILQSAMLRLLTLLPPGTVRFTVLDPVGLGENFASYMHLADYDPLLISKRIWTESGQIDEQLANLTEHMETVFQKYLRNEYETMEEYNVHAGEVAEPYRILIAADFPNGFSERAVQRLVSIATSGPRCGLYTLMSVDDGQEVPRGLDMADLERGATVVHWNGGGFESRAIDEDPLPLTVDLPPEASTFTAVVRKIGELSKDARRVEVPFHRIAPPADGCWTMDSRKGLEVPLGRSGATKLQHMSLGRGTSQHVLISGKTGSGKSTLLHILISNLALNYSPDEVELYLVDFKKGVEFKTYVTHRLPHVRVVAVESDREFGVSVLERLDAILKERGELFREHDVHDVASFRDKNPDVPMPRILFIVDEFQEFFVEDDRFSQQASLLLDRLVRQGRAFGMHVLLGSQTLGGAYSLARTTIGQMAVRIALQCSEADAHLILSEDNSAAKLLTRPGEAIYNDANGMVEGNNPFQVAWLTDDERDVYLKCVVDLTVERRMTIPAPIVFEGNVPADPLLNDDLVTLVESAGDESMTRPADNVVPAWLGEAVAITGPARIEYRNQSGNNLLIVGQNGEQALGIMAESLVSADACSDGSVIEVRTATKTPETKDDDFAGFGGFGDKPEAVTETEAEATSDASDVGQEVQRLPTICVLTSNANEPGRVEAWNRVTQSLAHPVKIVEPNDAGAVITAIGAEVARRRDGGSGSPVFLFVDDLSRFRDLRKSDDDFGFSGFGGGGEKTVTPSQALGEILKDGPALGVHTVVWCDSYNNVDRWFGRPLLREFEMRVVFQMSGADSSNLIDSPAATRLGTNRALLYRDERGTIEKFRPYGAPSDNWLEVVRTRRRPAKEGVADEAPTNDESRIVAETPTEAETPAVEQTPTPAESGQAAESATTVSTAADLAAMMDGGGSTNSGDDEEVADDIDMFTLN